MIPNWNERISLKLSTKQFIEIVAIFGVIASLIFVGMQLKLDRKVAQSDQYFNRAESRKADLRAFIESEAYMQTHDLWWEIGRRPSWWTDELEKNNQDYGANGRMVRAGILETLIGFIHLDSIYYLYQQDLLEEEIWIAARESIESGLNDPFIRSVYLNEGIDLPLRGEVERLISEMRVQ